MMQEYKSVAISTMLHSLKVDGVKVIDVSAYVLIDGRAFMARHMLDEAGLGALSQQARDNIVKAAKRKVLSELTAELVKEGLL